MEKLAVKKRIDSVILLRDTDKKLKIMFGGNLDLYFVLDWSNGDPNFLIGKDNYDVYQIFDRLYHNIMNGNIVLEKENEIDFIISECELLGEDYHKKLKDYEEKKKAVKQDALRIAQKTGLIDGEDIIFKSDEYRAEIAPYFRITKLGNAYQISFGIPKVESNNLDSNERDILYMKELGSIPIRINNSTSRYSMWNLPFMDVYNSLLELQQDYQQISIEEYMIEEEMKSGTDLEKILIFSRKNH